LDALLFTIKRIFGQRQIGKILNFLIKVLFRLMNHTVRIVQLLNVEGRHFTEVGGSKNTIFVALFNGHSAVLVERRLKD